MTTDSPKRENPYVRLRRACIEWGHKVLTPKQRRAFSYVRTDVERGMAYNLNDLLQHAFAHMAAAERYLELAGTTGVQVVDGAQRQEGG